MDLLEAGAPKVQHPLQGCVTYNFSADLPVALPVLNAARMSDRDSTEKLELVDEEPDPRTMAVRQLLVGVMLLVVGVVVTAATYSTARNDGDRYLLAFGPIVIGAIAMVRGFIGLLRP